MKTTARMMLLTTCLLALGGCSMMEWNNRTDEAAEVTKKVVVVVQGAAEKAEPVVVSVEEATGGVLTEGQKDTATQVAGTVETVATTASGIAGLIPGGQGIAAILGAVGTFAGFLSSWFARRKTKKVAKAAVLAADAVPTGAGGGQAITDAAITLGVVPEIRAALAEVKPGA